MHAASRKASTRVSMAAAEVPDGQVLGSAGTFWPARLAAGRAPVGALELEPELVPACRGTGDSTKCRYRV